MNPLLLELGGASPARVLAVGAHCDDIEIGAGGLLAAIARALPDTRFRFLVMTSTPERAGEARACLAELVSPAEAETTVLDLPDTRLPGRFDDVKDELAGLSRAPWDLVVTHSPDDAHQDHRLLGELTPTAFRDHLILHYEIPKWDGDLGTLRPNLYLPLTGHEVARKWALLDRHYVSQRGHDWFTEETFRSLARLRGMESRADYAEAFRVGKAVLQISSATGPRPSTTKDDA